jgi:two-component system OmpR family response regulator
MDPGDERLRRQVAVPVAVLHWPRDHDRRAELAGLGVPRLLLVAADAPAPEVADDEDWVRLPADERDTAARVAALRARRSGVTLAGTIVATTWGSATLSPNEAAALAVLLRVPGAVVAREEVAAALAAQVTSTARAVDDVVYRLRRRLRPLGLDIFASRGRGHLLGPRLDWPVSGELTLD